ncbi:uncharacterized protein N7503_006147 [Penicillium pulvis]|uniref:uncharacterized protein n=1 Tax=Penicillium pulvis TaxID=1562058 RepID=UPI002548E748|nr:uncharacterized protein N7503_006147 [Penicillium pulvis]KAJ5803697.1 hypothetical protein N7503_006147 [Penicillium pulvis]
MACDVSAQAPRKQPNAKTRPSFDENLRQLLLGLKRLVCPMGLASYVCNASQSRDNIKDFVFGFDPVVGYRQRTIWVDV